MWVTDFGLAHDASDNQTLTHTGDLLGTLRYLAPERLSGKGDARVDIYGLGVTLYELVCGRPAYPEADRATLLNRLLHHDPPGPRQVDPRIARDFETIVLKAMARDPAHRYATAGAMARGPHAVPRRSPDPGPASQPVGASPAMVPAQPDGCRRC